MKFAQYKFIYLIAVVSIFSTLRLYAEEEAVFCAKCVESQNQFSEIAAFMKTIKNASKEIDTQTTSTPYEFIWRTSFSQDRDTGADLKRLLDFIQIVKAKGWRIDIKEKHRRAGKRYDKKAEEKLEDIIIKKTLGCEKFDHQCERVIIINNRRKGQPFDFDQAGKLILPTLEIEYKIKLDVKENFSTKVLGGNELMLIFKREFYNLLKPIESNILLGTVLCISGTQCPKRIIRVE